ncbi:hypothetical protein [Nocardia sp. SYP-A9097]|uniref:hypothetical protein n=1 Tax=Nocardia sp. SYP-A9097 TaxID=2663237 RepID=UPI002814B6E5|nr:hypothetical protein [Nocardia sp. SYP-A9097]
MVWALLAGYARRPASESLQGKAIAFVMAGIPLALSPGIPLGTLLGDAVGWQVTFTVMPVLAVILLAPTLLVIVAARRHGFPMQSTAETG